MHEQKKRKLDVYRETRQIVGSRIRNLQPWYDVGFASSLPHVMLDNNQFQSQMVFQIKIYGRYNMQIQSTYQIRVAHNFQYFTILDGLLW